MFRRCAVGGIVALLVLAPPASPQAAPTPRPWAEHAVKSAKLGEPRTIYLATPPEYDSAGTKRYPVLVFLDANDHSQFTWVVGEVVLLAKRGVIPPLIVVGIPNTKDRTHDLTPPANVQGAKAFPTAGGAAAFADFIVDEVLPTVRAKYRLLPSTILAGHSFGGLFALDVAATKPDAFAGIVAMSPSLWWNDSKAADTYADAIAKAPHPPRLFVASGGREPDIDVATTRFARRLESKKTHALAFAHRRYPDDSHELTTMHSLPDGLRFVLEQRR